MRLFFLLSLAWSSVVTADTVMIAAEDAWPPFSDEQGMGLSYELANAAFATQGLTLQTQSVPYARALNLAMSGEVDACWNVTRQTSTEAVFLFGNEPLFRTSASFYYKRGKEKNYRSSADIPDGTRIAVINGYEYGEIFENNRARFQLVEVSKQKQMMALLQNERADMAIFFDLVFDFTILSSPYQSGQFSRGEINHVSDIFIAFNRDNPRSAELAQALDNGLKVLHNDGRYDEIMGEDASVF
jgi:polar amino acid transport system substrate-binding protein